MRSLSTWCLLALALFALPAQAQVSSALPENFPGFSRTSISPFYYATGLQLGQVLSIKRVRPIFSTYEGNMMLGFGSNAGEMVDRNCMEGMLPTQTRGNVTSEELTRLTQEARHNCALFLNPWRFSTLSSSLFGHVTAIKDRPVVIYYINYFSMVAPSHILMRTTNTLLDAFPVDANLPLEPNYRLPSWVDLHPEAGVITGRIVRASLEYSLRKTFEVVIQENQNSDNFTAMTVSDDGMFQYITQAMLTGKMLRIEFIRLYNIHSALIQSVWTHRTAFRIISVELVEDRTPAQ